MGDLKMAAFCVQHAAFMNNFKSNSTGGTGSTGRALSGNEGLEPTKHHLANSSSTSSISHSVKQQALVFSFLKDYDKSIATLEYELKLKQPSGELCNLLGRIFMKAKKWSNAVEAFDKSIDYNVSLAPVLFYFIFPSHWILNHIKLSLNSIFYCFR